MKTALPVAIIICIAFNYTYSQNSITLQPDAGDGKDVEIFDLEPNSNLDHEYLRGMAWTFNSIPGTVRGLLEFDLSSIPTGSKVDSAFLSLYAPTPPIVESHSGDNESYLRRVTSYWNENEVTWNIQPSTTNLHQVELERSSSEYQDYVNIDVTDLVHDMVNDPARSFGFMLRAQDEVYYKRMSFASSDATASSNHPKLVVYYKEPQCNTIFLQPGPAGKDAEIFSLQPNTTFDHPLVRSMTWTFSGDEGIVRGFLEFDLSQIPANSTIASAYLTLYGLELPHDQFNSGLNSAWLQRVTSDWEESTINWNNQPTVTSDNQVALPASTLDYQDYRSIDVTELVRDMVIDPNNSYGFRMSQQTEEIYRRLSFASGDNDNEKRHPRLEICYTETVSVKPEFQLPDAKISPNPWQDYVRFHSGNLNADYKLEVIDLFGHSVFREDIQPDTDIRLSLTPGMYIFKVTDNQSGKIHVTKMLQQ